MGDSEISEIVKAHNEGEGEEQIHRAKSNRKRKKSWVERLQRDPLFILVGIIGIALGATFDLLDKAGKVLFKSDALVLAENSDRSHFSDDLIRGADKRLFLADLFATRVGDDAPPRLIEESWKEYMTSLQNWNADLLINIAGLANYYSPKLSYYFENDIQTKMKASDSAVRALGTSPYLKSILKDPAANTSGLEKGNVGAVYVATDAARNSLYGFIFCMKPKTEDEKNRCKARGIETP